MSEDTPLPERYLGRRVINWLVIAVLSLLVILLGLIISGRQIHVGDQNIGVSHPSHDVPVGSIFAFWGSPKTIPDGFEVCDGKQVVTEGSPIRGHDKPNLEGRYLKGAPASREQVANLLKGGSAEVVLTVDHLPPHTHELSQRLVHDGIEHHSNYKRSYIGEGKDVAAVVTKATGASKPLPIEPPFAEVFYIIKVR